MIEKRYRPYAVDIVAGVYALTYLAWRAVRQPATPGTARISDLAFWPLGLFIAWACARNATMPAIDRRTRIGWWLLTAAALSLWISGNTWSLLNRLGWSQQPAW